MSKRPFYTALGYLTWKAGKFTARHKAKQVVDSPAIIVAAVVVAGLVAGGATLAASSELSED